MDTDLSQVRYTRFREESFLRKKKKLELKIQESLSQKLQVDQTHSLSKSSSSVLRRSFYILESDPLKTTLLIDAVESASVFHAAKNLKPGSFHLKTKKEGVSRTYKGYDGYAPIAAYLGNEGWCLANKPMGSYSSK